MPNKNQKNESPVPVDETDTPIEEHADELWTADEPILSAPAEEEAPNPLEDAPVEELAADLVAESPDDIVVNDVQEDEPEPEPLRPARIARAVQVVDGEVSNVLLVGVDEDDKVVGFEVPYGTELFVVEDDSPVQIGWKHADGDFAEPTE